MNKSLWSLVFFLVSSVTAGGYAGAAERVWLYYAYLIDGRNPGPQQTLGFSCVSPKGVTPVLKGKALFDAGTCNGVWESCADNQGVAAKGRTRCNFTELMRSLGRVQPNVEILRGGVDPNTITPEVRATAIDYHYYMVVRQQSKVPDYPAQNFLKYSNGDYAAMIKEVGNVVSTTTGARGTTGYEAQVTGFKESSDEVIVARAGDHGISLIPAARAYLGPLGLDVISVELDPPEAPVTRPGETEPAPWHAIDWVKTVQGSTLSVETTENIIVDFLDEFYNPEGVATTKDQRIAQEHRVVLQAFKDTKDRMSNC